jgi:2,3-bisphosphoglycerate-independent phosphoglycerate mutase
MDTPVAIAILPDHPTPWKLKTHTRDAVPFLIWYPGIEPDEVSCYDELSARKGGYGILESPQFMQKLLQNK